MFYPKNIKKTVNNAKKSVVFDFSGGVDDYNDDSLLSLKYAKRAFNFDFSSGALKDGAGILDINKVFGNLNFKLPSKAVKGYFYKRQDYLNNMQDDRLLIYAQDNNMYQIKLSQPNAVFEKVESLSFSSAPSHVNYKYGDEDTIIFSARGEGVKIYNGSSYPLEAANAPEITSMCLHYERLFATSANKTTLWFSDDFDLANWYVSLSEAGYIDMPNERGALLKVVSFLDYLYVFRTYGISRVSAFGSQQEFSVSDLFTTSGKIFAQSVTVCGDRIIFLADGGLYRFDGISTKRILTGYSKHFVDTEFAKGLYLNGKFYLLFDIKEQGKLSRALLSFDISTNSAHIAKLNVFDIFKITADNISAVCLITSGKIAALSNNASEFNTPLEKIWQSPQTSLDTNKQKIIKQISLFLRGRVSVIISNGRESVRLNLQANGEIVKTKLYLKGSLFTITFKSSNCGLEVSRPQITFDEL